MNIYFSFRIGRYSFNVSFNLSFSKSNLFNKQNYGNKNHESCTAGRRPDCAEP